MAEGYDDPLFERARLGAEAEAFFSSNLGKYIVKRAQAQIEEGYKALAEADPFDQKEIVRLQSYVSIARAVPEWLAQLINDGEIAFHQIQEEEAYET